ncbi:MAG: HEAT repeat domain-containing protein [Planctomycetota bacterium]
MLPLLCVTLLAGAAQEPDLSRLDVFLDKAVHGSAVIRPQAAARLVPMGKPAADRILALCADGPPAIAALGSELVEVFGAFQDTRLRELLWQCLEDRDFPWRPAAARSLASNPLVDGRETETRAFHALLSDPIAPVRMAAVQAFANLHPEPLPQMRVELRAMLSDPSDFVRRAAAVTLVNWGEPEALLWLIEDLRRSDTFFERWSAKNAAYESRRALSKLLGDTFGYDPELPADAPTNVAAVSALDRAARARIGDRPVPELPEVARASGPVTDAVLGLELVSCRRGEHYLCWTSSDELLVGLGNPARVALPEGTTARLLALALEEVAKVEKPYYGVPGCDLEALRIADPPRALTLVDPLEGPGERRGAAPRSARASDARPHRLDPSRARGGRPAPRGPARRRARDHGRGRRPVARSPREGPSTRSMGRLRARGARPGRRSCSRRTRSPRRLRCPSGERRRA